MDLEGCFRMDTLITFILLAVLVFGLMPYASWVRRGGQYRRRKDTVALTAIFLALFVPLLFPKAMQFTAGITAWILVVLMQLGRIGYASGLLDRDSDAKTMPAFNIETFEREQKKLERTANEKEVELPPPASQEAFLQRVEDQTQ